VQDFVAGSADDVIRFEASGFTSLADVISHSFQNGAYLVIQVDADTAVWLNGVTAAQLTDSDFVFV
jgi:hypothetical protein